ncbi:MAG TPA: acyl-ACP desaturase, partial [Pseudonocardiaceae bacterium]|nr:acyl-ACP desaturase [Pseudonocardiaceae bacterium]
MTTTADSTSLLYDLEPVVSENLHRHLAAARDWMPHEYVPWSQGRDYADLGGEPFDPEQSRLSPLARTA